jgi:pyruvate dehydrogenase E1 component
LRDHFEVDWRYVVIGALSALAREGSIDPLLVQRALQQYGIDPERSNPAGA